VANYFNSGWLRGRIDLYTVFSSQLLSFHVVFSKPQINLRPKIEISNQILEQVTCFNYLGYNISYVRSEDPEIKLVKFLQRKSTIERTLLKGQGNKQFLSFIKHWLSLSCCVVQRIGH
jgi:hypothetical protein